jgi:hypothetical protein
MIIMVEEPLLCDELDRANKRQLAEAETKSRKELDV